MTVNQPPILDSSLSSLNDWNSDVANAINTTDARLKDFIAGGKINVTNSELLAGSVTTDKIFPDGVGIMFRFASGAMADDTFKTFYFRPPIKGIDYTAFVFFTYDVTTTTTILPDTFKYDVYWETDGYGIGAWQTNLPVMGKGALNPSSWGSVFGSSNEPFPLKGGKLYTTRFKITEGSFDSSGNPATYITGREMTANFVLRAR